MDHGPEQSGGAQTVSRRAGRAARRAKRELAGGARAVGPGAVGGRYRPLTDPDLQRIHRTALDVLETIDMLENVHDDTLSYGIIKSAVEGPGHYLGNAQTLALMEMEYVHPTLGDRRTADQWEQDGAPDIRERARQRMRDVLGSHYPNYIEPAVDEALRRRFPILLPVEAMRPGSGRW